MSGCSSTSPSWWEGQVIRVRHDRREIIHLGKSGCCYRGEWTSGFNSEKLILEWASYGSEISVLILLSYCSLFFYKKWPITSLLLVWSCYHNETPETFSLISRTWFSQASGGWDVWDEGAGRARCTTGPLPLVCRELGAHMALPQSLWAGWEQADASGASSSKGTNHPRRTPSSWTCWILITSQALHLQIPSHWGLDV